MSGKKPDGPPTIKVVSISGIGRLSVYFPKSGRTILFNPREPVELLANEANEVLRMPDFRPYHDTPEEAAAAASASTDDPEEES